MKASIAHFLKKLGLSLKKLSESGENQCRRCGLCHHVCKILKNKNSVKWREE